MNEKENRPGWCEHPGQQLGILGFSENNSTTSDGTISSLLLPGQRNSIGLKTLAQWTGLDGRTIRRMISEEREMLIPIVADCKSGYYLAETELEKNICARSMYHRSEEIRRAADCISKASVWRG